MLKDRNIAFFIDLYNAEVSAQSFNDILAQLEQMGTIISGTIYGATERNHKDVLAQADVCGYTVVRGSRKRGRKAFDHRIIVDVVDKINHSIGIDTVCIVAFPSDMVYLYAYIRERGIKVISLNNCDEATMALVDETVDTGKVETIKLPKFPVQPKVAPVVAPVIEEPVAEEPLAPVEVAIEEPVEEPVVETPAEPAPTPAEPTVSAEVSRMDQLLKEIDRLRAEVEKTTVAPVEVPEAPVEEPIVETPVEPIPVEVVEPVEAPAEEPVAPAPVEEPVETPVEQPSQPRAAYAPQDDADLLRKIEEMRKGAGSTDDLIDEIKKLLDDIE
ncbi:MAG: NYN domain-containing protein [Clostridia bacterium]|nr:NYN domain-containing protein [Clostridia bacterium]